MKIQHLAVVLFAYNEEGNLLRLLRRVRDQLDLIFPHQRSVIQYCICIQGRQEGVTEVQTFAQETQGSQILYQHSERPLGIRGAAWQAFDLVQGQPDAYLMMDCDLNHQPEELPQFFSHLVPGTVVVGSRYIPQGRILGMPLWKKVLSRWVNALLSAGLRFPIHDKTSGYRLIAEGSHKDVRSIAHSVVGVGFDFYIEFLLRLWRQGFRITEVPITFKVRTVGQSKLRIFQTLWNYLRLILRLSRISIQIDPALEQAEPGQARSS